MRLEIVGIENRGVANQERLRLKIKADTVLSFHMVFAADYADKEHLTRAPRSVFWFPATPTKAGDTVLLYSGSGEDRRTKNVDGTTTHQFYWGSRTTLWNSIGQCAVVFEIVDWRTSKYE